MLLLFIIRVIGDQKINLQQTLNASKFRVDSGHDMTDRTVAFAAPMRQLRDCDLLYDQGNTTSGVMMLSLMGRMVEVYCDMNGIGNNWLVSTLALSRIRKLSYVIS